MQKRRYNPAVKRFNTRVKKRDNNQCQHCGQPENADNLLTVHHIHGWAVHPHLRFAMWNVITLCDYCHRVEHGFLDLPGQLIEHIFGVKERVYWGQHG